MPQPQSFRRTVANLLPSEEKLLALLAHLEPQDRQSIVENFGMTLRDFDLVIGMPGSAALAGELASLRGTPCVMATAQDASGRWALGQVDDPKVKTAVIVTNHLQSGLDELQVAVLATQRGWQVLTVAAAVERTNDRARARLELQGFTLRAVVQVADTPRGLVLERRFPQGQ